jgi:serine/threonine-protein kinase
MKKCPHCSAQVAEDARFCPACGKQTIATESSANTMPAAERDMVGREIAGRYRILKKLGEGGMGAVYRAEQMSLKRQVAVKVLRPELSQNQMLVRRFDAEAQAVAKLNHPNIVGIYDNGQDTDGSLFIAMEFIEGRSLRSVINHEAPFHPQRALAIASQVAAALTDAHANSIVHRDLKPDNVMLQDRGRQRDIVRVLDFGIAKLRDDSRATQQAMTQAGDMLGTPQYMAPEQIKGEHVDGRTDVYALGCMIYEMITGRQPFEATTVMAMLSKHLMESVVAPSQRRPDLPIPPEIDRLVLTAMMKDPAARPPTMELYGEQIAALQQALPADPNRSMGAPLSSVQNAPTPPAITPPAHSAYMQNAPTPPGPMTPAPPHAYAPPPVAAAPSQFPPSQLPTLMRGGARTKPRSSKAVLWSALLLIVVGGGGVAAYFLTKEKPKADVDHVDDGSDTHDPTPQEPPPEPPKKDPWAGGDTSVPSVAAPHAKAVLSGQIENVAQGVRINVPTGFNTQHVGDGLAAGTTEYLITAGPLNTNKSDPNDIARDYAVANGLSFDGLQTVKYAGADRVMARFHGTVNGASIAQIVVAYTGTRYSIVVGLTVKYGVRNDSGTLRFASELFDKRVLLP